MANVTQYYAGLPPSAVDDDSRYSSFPPYDPLMQLVNPHEQEVSATVIASAKDPDDVDARFSAQMDPDDRVGAHQVDLVAQARFGRDPAEIDVEVDRIGGFALIPVDEELNPDDLLAKGKAPVWFSSQMAPGGIGRSVDLTKKEDKENVPDTDRQEKVDKEFMKLKLSLGLGRHDGLEMGVVNYSIAGHYIRVFDKATGELTGEYDLLDKADIKRLLHDRQMPTSDAYVNDVHSKLIGINREIKKLIEHETGKKQGYSFVSENGGNLKGHAPFVARSSAQAHKVFSKDTKHGLYQKTMDRLGLITTEKRSALKSDIHRLTPNGAEALNDIERAIALKNILTKNLDRQISVRQAQVKQLKQQPPTPENKREIKRLKGEIAQLTKAAQEIQNINPTVLNLTMMELNRTFEYREPVRSADDQLAMVQKRSTGKELLQPISADQRRLHGVHPLDVHGADVVRNDRVDIVANGAAQDVEKMVSEENRHRPSMMTPWRKADHDLNLEDKQMATDVGALIHQVAAMPSTDPSRIRLAKFLGTRGGKFAQGSRALEFLISGVVHGGHPGFRGFSQESDVVKDVLNASLGQYRDYLAGAPTAPRYVGAAPAYQRGLDVDPILKAHAATAA